MHCPQSFGNSDDPSWNETRQFLECVYKELQKANKGTLLGVPVLERKTNKVHLEMEPGLEENIEDLQKKIGMLGERLMVAVEYISDVPENL